MQSVLEALRRLPDLGDPYEDERRALTTIATDIPAAGVWDASRARALRYIDAVRAADTALLSAQNLLNSFPLATPEGIALLRLAEALLRAPDAETQTWLIAEKLAHFRDTRIGLDGNFVTRVLATALKIAGHTAADAELQDAIDRGLRDERRAAPSSSCAPAGGGREATVGKQICYQPRVQLRH